MKLLLDTHTLLWWLDGGKQLTKPALEAIASESSTVWVSIASAWEITIKTALGKLSTPSQLAEELDHHNFELLPIELIHLETLKNIPMLHKDPFDRILIAQAQYEDLTLVTRDPNIKNYKIKCLSA